MKRHATCALLAILLAACTAQEQEDTTGRYDLALWLADAEPCPSYEIPAQLVFEIDETEDGYRFSTDDPDVTTISGVVGGSATASSTQAYPAVEVIVELQRRWPVNSGPEQAPTVEEYRLALDGSSVTGLGTATLIWHDDAEDGISLGSILCTFTIDVTGERL